MLRQVDLFSELSDAQLDLMGARSIVRTYPKGAIIVNEGEEGNALFVIQSGTVKTYLSEGNGKEVLLSTQGKGEYFGELALFDNAPRSASVAVIDQCKVSIISKAMLRDALHEKPEIALALLKGLAARVRALTENVRTLGIAGRIRPAGCHAIFTFPGNG